MTLGAASSGAVHRQGDEEHWFTRLPAYGAPIGHAFAASTTTYAPAVGSAAATPTTTETHHQGVVHIAGTLTASYIWVSANAISAASCVVTLRLNGAASAKTATLTSVSGTGLFELAGADVSVAAGDLLSVEFASGATVGSLTVRGILVKFRKA